MSEQAAIAAGVSSLGCELGVPLAHPVVPPPRRDRRGGQPNECTRESEARHFAAFGDSVRSPLRLRIGSRAPSAARRPAAVIS